METSIKKLEHSIVELTIEETSENILKYRKKVISHLAKNAEIKGFRKWTNIPEAVILKNYSEEQILAFSIDEALKDLYSKALKDNNIFPITQGEVKEIISQSPLKLIMHVEVFPEVEIKKWYKDVKVTKTEFWVDDAEVETALEEIQNRFTKFVTTQAWYEAKNGDKMVISTQGFDADGKKLENTNMEEYPLVLGSNILVPGFEEQLVGKTSGNTYTLDIVFPTDYHNADFAGKNTKFEVTIWEIQTSVKPEFTPEFIKQLRGKDLDLAGFKALIKEELFETKENNARIQDENKLMDELTKFATIDFGESILKNQVSKVYEEIKQNIASSGAKTLDYISSLGMTEEQYIETQVKPVAVKRLQAELILHKLQEIEKVVVKDEEVNSEIEKIMSRFESEDVKSRLKELYVPGTKYYEELKQRITYKNVIDSFLV